MQSISSGTEPIITASRSPIITTESLSGNIGCSFFDVCNNHKVNDTEEELDCCGPCRRLSNSIFKSANSVSQTRLDNNDVDAVRTIISTMFDYSNRYVVSKLTVRSMFRLGKKTSDNHLRLLKDISHEERMLLLNAKQELARRRGEAICALVSNLHGPLSAGSISVGSLVDFSLVKTDIAASANKHDLLIGYFNIRSLTSNLDNLRIMLTTKHLDAFTVSESWLHSRIGDVTINIQGYTVTRSDMCDVRRGFGVAIYLAHGAVVVGSVHSVDRCWHVIRDKLLEVSNKFVPKIVIKKRYNRKPFWFDHDLKKALYERNRF
ncbi:hypothetical protein GJ496_003548 [Pomphorhynchus laevis]|nr:hypothetical protein GJ496_003548 [Pomphorhynchus laevis]